MNGIIIPLSVEILSDYVLKLHCQISVLANMQQVEQEYDAVSLSVGVYLAKHYGINRLLAIQVTAHLTAEKTDLK